VSWFRATVYGFVAVAVAFILWVYVPDYIVSNMTSVSRSTRALAATGWFTVAVIGVLWGLRRIQQRLLDSASASSTGLTTTSGSEAPSRSTDSVPTADQTS
jgi:uncharacterized protein (UPF0261 family)